MGYRERKKGFTLVELVVVMVILGVTATAAVSFLWMGTKMFVGLSNRVQLSTVAHNFMMRLRLQVESAMPYSLSAETNSYTGNPSRTALSMVIPKGSYRIAQISGTDTIFLPLEEKDPLCKYLKSTNPELRYLNENHTYSSITIPKNSLKTLSGDNAFPVTKAWYNAQLKKGAAHMFQGFSEKTAENAVSLRAKIEYGAKPLKAGL